MLKSLQLKNFKGFRNFTASFGNRAFLVGPNNAGKSTVIAATRAGANALRVARAFRADHGQFVDGSLRRGHAISGERLSLIEENLRHEFHQAETRLVFRFSGDAVLTLVWEADDDEGLPPAFCFLRRDGRELTRPADVRNGFPDIGVIPVLSPLELEETVLSADHVQGSAERRLVSQHLRNHLYALSQQPAAQDGFSDRLEEFRSFAEPWLAEIDLGALERRRSDGGGLNLDLYYSEPEGRHEKEVFWAGDGMQIWLQLVLHAFRLLSRDLVVLDEPDLFLHPDLQRRLVRLLESHPAQVITATHSSEVLAEVPAESVVWVSRSRKNSVRAPGPELMGEISGVLGTGFNLRLARALRARLVVFVEGDDTKVLRELATVAGAEAISAEREVVVIPLKGFDRWRGVEVFAWVLQDFLEGSVPTWVFLDRDVRDDKTVEEIESALKKAGANPHVWQKHELENYLVVSSPISRASGAPVGFVDDAIDEALEELKEPLRARYTNELMAGRGKLKDPGKAAIAANKRLERVWTSRAKRVDAVPGKELLAGVRRRLQDAGHEAVGDRSLAREFRAKEIAPELFEALATLEKQL